MDGLEISEAMLSDIDLGDRYDAEYFTKEYLYIEQQLEKVKTKKIGELSTTVASAFYPAATHLYAIGDTAFARCVDCVSFPIITRDQDERFEKIPYKFAAESKGISVLKEEDIIITKVGTPCFASIITGYEQLALSRTVLGLSDIHGVDPYYLMVFLRCKYGFEQLFRQRELTIQYQLTLPRIKAVSVYIPTEGFQKTIRKLCDKYLKSLTGARTLYSNAETIINKEFNLPDLPETSISTKTISSSFCVTGRIDAEYYQPKYDVLYSALKKLNTLKLGGENGIVSFLRSIEPGSDAYCEEGIPFVRVSDIGKFGISLPEIKLSQDVVDNVESLFPKKDTILFSKDGSVGIAYKMENDAEVITSSALLHLKVKNPEAVLPDYLTLVLNSSVVQLQAERDANGAIIQHWKPSEIADVIIPILPIAKQEEIAKMVQDSFTLRHNAELLLEHAKRAVEIAIEQGEDAAWAWLEDNATTADDIVFG